MMKIKLLIAAVFAVALVTTSFGVKGDTAEGSQGVEEKVEVVDDSVKAKTVVDTVAIEQPKHPLEPLMMAIMWVESKGKSNAYNPKGDCVGVLQITPVCVRECNNILAKNKSKKRYSYADRWDRQKSIEMFYIIQEEHNPKYDYSKGIRLWNASPKYKKRVLKALKTSK